MSIIEELLGRNSSGSGLENQEYDHRDLPHNTLYLQKLALTSATSGSRSVADFYFFYIGRHTIATTPQRDSFEELHKKALNLTNCKTNYFVKCFL
jgi:hypothetical protein